MRLSAEMLDVDRADDEEDSLPSSRNSPAAGPSPRRSSSPRVKPARLGFGKRLSVAPAKEEESRTPRPMSRMVLKSREGQVLQSQGLVRTAKGLEKLRTRNRRYA